MPYDDEDERRKSERREIEWGIFKADHESLKEQIRKAQATLDGLRDAFDKVYAPIIVKTIVFGGCAMILSAVVVGILALVVKQK